MSLCISTTIRVDLADHRDSALPGHIGSTAIFTGICLIEADPRYTPCSYASDTNVGDFANNDPLSFTGDREKEAMPPGED